MADETKQRWEWITHKGQRILYLDYRGLKGDDAANQVREFGDLIVSLGRQGFRKQLRLVDVRGSVMNQAAMDAFKSVGVKINPYSQATAIVGIRGVQKVLVSIYNQITGRGTKPFDDVEKAKDWLVDQAVK